VFFDLKMDKLFIILFPIISIFGFFQIQMYRQIQFLPQLDLKESIKYFSICSLIYLIILFLL